MILRRLRQWLAQRVDGGSLAVVRIAVGSVLFLEAIKLLWPTGDATLLANSFLTPGYLFAYPGFEWIQPWPEPWLTAHCCVLAMSSVFLALGWRHRIAGASASALWMYLLLLDATRFNNHYYLEVLLSLLLAFTPAHRRYSVWAMRRRSDDEPGSVPFWSVLLIRAQLAVVYFWGGVAKLSPEWLVHAEPMQMLLHDPRTKLRALHALPDAWVEALWSAVPSPAYFLSYGGTLFDLMVVPLLICRRTRLFAFGLVVLFHLTNHFVLFDDIGFFPALGIAATTIYFAPDWPKRLGDGIARPRWPRPDWGWLAAGAILLPPLGWLLGWKGRPALRATTAQDRALAWFPTTLIVGWIVVQAGLPLAQFAMPEPLLWTGKAEQFFWRMKSGVKIASDVRIDIDDAHVAQTAAQDGEASVDWNSWPGERVLYRELDPANVDVQAWPSLFVEFQPLFGERVLYNPRSHRDAMSRADVVDVWKRKNGRRPRLTRTESLADILRAMHAGLSGKVDATTLARVTTAHAVARRIELGQIDPMDQPTLLESVRLELRDLCLAADTELAEFARSSMRFVQPLALVSTNAPRSAFYVIDDDTLYQPMAERYRGVYRAMARHPRGDDAEPLEVFTCLDRLTPIELSFLPRFRLQTAVDGQVSVLWNPYRELVEHQWLIAFTQPRLCRQYALHVAEQWRRLSGRRAAVRMRVHLMVAPYRQCPLIDPDVDLTGTTWRVFGTNSWIEPFRREVDATRFRAAEALGKALETPSN